MSQSPKEPITVRHIRAGASQPMQTDYSSLPELIPCFTHVIKCQRDRRQGSEHLLQKVIRLDLEERVLLFGGVLSEPEP